MDWDELVEHWGFAKDAVRKRWARLTDDDAEHIGGDRELFIGRIQDRYALERQQAAKEVDEFVASYAREG